MGIKIILFLLLQLAPLAFNILNGKEEGKKDAALIRLTWGTNVLGSRFHAGRWLWRAAETFFLFGWPFALLLYSGIKIDRALFLVAAAIPFYAVVFAVVFNLEINKQLDRDPFAVGKTAKTDRLLASLAGAFPARLAERWPRAAGAWRWLFTIRNIYAMLIGFTGGVYGRKVWEVCRALAEL